MNLTHKSLGAVAALFLVSGTASYVVQEWLVLPSFERVERSAVETDMRRVLTTLDREMVLFQAFAADWGNWNEAYEFAVNRHESFIADNLNQVTFDANRLDIVAFVDPSSNFVWRAGIGPGSRMERRYAVISGAHLDPGSPFRAAIASGKQLSGIVSTELGPALIAVAPILDGAGGGPHRGAVLLGRVITHDVVDGIGQQAQVPLRMEVLPRDAPPAQMADAAEIHLVTGEESIVASKVVSDVFGHAALRFSLEQPRVITQRGRETVRIAVILLAGIGLLTLFAVLMTLRYLVLTPVRQIREFVRGVTASDDLSLRLELARPDELGAAARDLNVMVERLATARREVADKSFEAGLSEMARGVLHNLGNALTPVMVNAGRARGELVALPTGEIAQAIDGLGRPDLPADRRVAMLRFLQVANDDLQLRAAESAKQVTTVMLGLDAIQTILQQQSRFSHARQVMEKVSLSEVVDQSLRMVAPVKLAQLDVCVDSSVVDMEPLRLPRIVLEQVVQNLIVNASEATMPGRPSRLTIAACIEGAPRHEHLHLTIGDDGRGIPPDNIDRIFRKGFSTKAGDTNSGLGLHWCANVIHGLGGKLQAESPGPGLGATFHIFVPLASTAQDGSLGSSSA